MWGAEVKLEEAIAECLESKAKLKFRRSSWSHGDSLVIANAGSYGGGEIYWDISGNRAALFYVSDIIANDWGVE